LKFGKSQDHSKLVNFGSSNKLEFNLGSFVVEKSLQKCIEMV